MKTPEASVRISKSPKPRANQPDNVLHHCWHAVAWARDVTEKPLAVNLLDHPVVLWRSENGVVAFKDLCIHRGTPL